MRRIAVIPCYNEEKSICGVVAAARFHIDDVLVSDDNSTNGTISEAKEYGALIVESNDKGKGAGIATWRGVKRALEMGADSVITLDGDGQHNPVEIANFIGHMSKEGECDLLIGSRFMGEYKIARYRKLGIDIITWLYNLGHKDKITDAQSCFRAYSKELLARNIMTENGFAFSVETLIKARAYGFKIKEIPISCIYHKEHSQNSTLNPVRHGLGVALAVIKWRVKIEAMELPKRLAFGIVGMVASPLIAKGWGRFRLLRYMYSKITKRLIPEEMKVVQIENFKMKVNTDERGLDGMTTIVVTRKYEAMTAKVLKSILQEGMNVIDVGACIGYHTVSASKLVGESGKVWAIEPEPHNFQDLQGNIALNHLTNVIATEKAASDKSGKADLFICKGSSGNHSLLATPFLDKNRHIEVETIKLDDLINGQRIDFIKTDTEGHEISVLSGATNIITCNKNLVLITEFLSSGIEASGHTPEMFWRMLEGYNFKFIYIIDERKKEILTGTCAEAVKRCQGGKFSVNLLCSRNHISI